MGWREVGRGKNPRPKEEKIRSQKDIDTATLNFHILKKSGLPTKNRVFAAKDNAGFGTKNRVLEENLVFPTRAKPIKNPIKSRKNPVKRR